MTKKHLLFSGNNAWGMYNFRHELLRHFVEKGYRVSVSAPYDEEQFRMLRELGCEVYPIRMKPRGTNPLHDFSLFLQQCLSPDSEPPEYISAIRSVFLDH